MLFSIDRILGGIAMLMGEDKQPLEVPAEMLPQGAKEGEMVRYTDGVFILAPEETAARRRRIAEMLGRLLQDDDE